MTRCRSETGPESPEMRNTKIEIRNPGSAHRVGPTAALLVIACALALLIPAARPAAGMANENGKSIAVLHIEQAWPFPADKVAESMNKAGRTIIAELNSTGQMARLVKVETGLDFDRKILKYDGRPFLPDELAEELGKEGADG